MELVKSIQLSPIATIITDPRQDDNPIIAVNDRFERLTGYARDELIGRNCRFLAGPGTDRAQSRALAQAVASAEPTMVELLNYRKDGSRFLNAVMIAPVFGADGELAYFVGSQMEIDAPRKSADRILAAERMSSLTRQQQAVLKLMARGLRNKEIAHELGLAEKSVRTYRSALMRRLGVSTAIEAVRVSIEAGF